VSLKISDCFSSSDNTSYGRIISFISVVFLLSWVSALLYKMYNMSTLTVADLRVAIPEIPPTWLAIILGPYGISKGFQVAGLIFGTKKEGEV
jgi:hypothetical protein